MRHTAQSYYDLLVVSALDGMFPALQGSDAGHKSCRYRTEPDENGVVHKCAFGVLIPDELYEPLFEVTGSILFLPRHLVWAVIPEGMDVDELRRIQRSHDDPSKRGPYYAKRFIESINAMSCFDNVKKVKGSTVKGAA